MDDYFVVDPMAQNNQYYLARFKHLDFAGLSPRKRGERTYAAGLPRMHLADREFDRMLNPAPHLLANVSVQDRERESLEACRQWYAGWDDSHREATRVSLSEPTDNDVEAPCSANMNT